MKSLAIRVEAQESMIPLARALDIIAAQIESAPTRAGRPELFDGLACTVSALVPMFILDRGAPRQLSDLELDKALFRKAGRRAPVGDLAVTSEGIAKVIRILKGPALQD